MSSRLRSVWGWGKRKFRRILNSLKYNWDFFKRTKIYRISAVELPTRLILCSLILCFILGGVAAGLVTAYLAKLPQLEWLEDYFPPVSTLIYSHDDQLIGQLYQQQRIFIPLSEIPQELIKAFLAVEDEDFYSHHGIDFTAILRAFYVNFRAGKIKEGGSTITQQLAKVLFLTPERSLSRKIKEAILAIQIEQRYTKNEILELYLNQIYLGNGAYGVEAAARAIFGKSVRELTLPECAMIAGLAGSPGRYSPFADFYLALERRNHVLQRMLEAEYISKEQFRSAISSPLRLPSKQKEELASYFIEYVRQYIEEKYGANLLYRSGLHVYTTLDAEMQRAAEQAAAAGLEAIDLRREASGLQRRGARSVEAALVAIDPRSGFVKSMVGGRDFFRSKFNRATQARRQPGSAIKPIIYTAAIERGFTAADIIIDSPFILKRSGGEVWKPENFTRRFYGPTTLRTALEKSRNVVTVKLANALGIDVIISTMRAMGITSPIPPVLSIALGSCELSLLELTSAYGVLANGGIRVEPLFIRRVTDQRGRVLEENIPRKNRAISPQTAYIITSILQGAIQRGTGWPARVLPYPLAGKTGTTDRATDAWFIGYSPDLVAGVWVGLDNNQSLGPNETGAQAACPIWVKFMGRALNRQAKSSKFEIPDGLSFVFIDPETGLLAPDDLPNKFLEVFKKGTEPKKYSPAKKKIKIQENDFYLNFID
ncbi:MAG: PBP1A family penicillin-binding protein [bacterium]|nr:PBP1A family penicillin-binding protein [bacterium]